MKYIKTLVGIVTVAVLGLGTLKAQAFLAPTNPAPQVILAWNPSVGATNYFVYYGVGSGQYTNKLSVGNNTTNLTVTLPARGVNFFFAVTAQANNLESTFSNEVHYQPPTPPGAPTLQPIVILTVQISPTSTGVFADSPMNWPLSPDQSDQYFKLRISRGMIASATLPPIPHR